MGLRGVLVAPLLVAGVVVTMAASGRVPIRARAPSYVLHMALPSPDAALQLPRVEGPLDAARPLVVIDAGHGGHDPGANGGSLHEKDVTLALAQALRERLLADGRVRVAMTRGDDRFLPLGDRAEIARRLHADLFVSIHADAAPPADGSTPDSVGPAGATVYTLSDTASDDVAARLAARENAADMLNGVSLAGRSAAVSSILVDLSRESAARSSQQFSDLVVREASGRIGLHHQPQRQAGFAVLKSLDLPSALVEAGYITGREDAGRLADPAWRGTFAQTLASAVEIFLARRNVGAGDGLPGA